MSTNLPPALAPINAATVHVAIPPVFQSGSSGVSEATQQSITVTGSAIFGGQQLSAGSTPRR